MKIIPNVRGYMGRLVTVILFTLLISCTSDKSFDSGTVNPDKILARVGNRIITTEDFIRRAEYTVRPNYCRGRSYVHKKIILNSLIAEKLFALEAEQAAVPSDNSILDNYLTGRKEQAMRQVHLARLGFGKVKIPDGSVSKSMRMARRAYRVEYLSLPDSSVAASVNAALDGGLGFEEIIAAISDENDIPSRELNWFEAVDLNIDSRVFNRKNKVGDILGPLKIYDGSFLALKIISWRDQFSLDESSTKVLEDDVTSKLKEKTAFKHYNRHVSDLMAGKSLQLEETSFYKLVDELAENYFIDDESREMAFNQAIWEYDRQQAGPREVAGLDLEENQPIFSFDGDVWTMGEFRNQLEKHPLVFRNRQFTRAEFAEGVKLAIVDLMQDHVITTEAYSLGYDEDISVKLNHEMWQDHFLARYYRNGFFTGIIDSSDFSLDQDRLINKYLDPVVDQLQNKYSDQVGINFNLLDQIEFSQVDMFVIQRNVPFPVIVPSFPLTTTDYVLDYGSKIE